VGTPGEGISNIVVEYAHGINEAVQHLSGRAPIASIESM